MACLVSVTGWLIGHTRVDRDMTRTLADEREAARLAEAAVQLAALALGRVPDWSRVDALALPLSCADAPGPLVGLDAAAETSRVQAIEDAASRWGVDTPRWRLAWQCHAAGVLVAWPRAGTTPSVGIWVGDDVEGDGAPWIDTNQRIRVLGVVAGRGGARSSQVVTIARSASGAPVTLLAWRSGQY
ncbi:hypothetical protein [Luteitalea sp. TBR-22]|uniref:hypothetical protein n=1 Tax=Luteitalea sp. TBR-22 TaxID=2802971 RepID=UPI001EF50EB6|nr:hypothetical protein [Luteitalea sp. TBR-22]